MAASDLNDVQNDAAAHTNWLAPKLRTVSTVAARAIGVLVALGSMAAVAIEGALSMAGYGLALLLGKIRPLRDAYQFLSLGYDRFIERLGQKVLRDTRDTPALRLMVSHADHRPYFHNPVDSGQTAAAFSNRILSFADRPEISALRPDVQHQASRGASPARLLRG